MKSFRVIYIILFLILLYFCFIPLGMIIFKSLLPQNLENTFLLLSKRNNWMALINTLILCSTVTVFSVLIGLPLAWCLHAVPLPKGGLWKSLFSIPYIIPPYIGAIAWIKLLNPTSGWLNQFFSTSFNIYSFWGATWVLGLFFYSFIFLPCTNALKNMDPSLEDAAYLSGANSWKVFKDITLPLLFPALLSGIILVIITTAAAFGVPALLLIPVRTFVLTTKIYTDVLSYSDGILKASGLSLVLITIGLIGLCFSHFILNNKRFTTITGKFSYKELSRFQSWKWPTLVIFILVWCIFVFLPLTTIVITSLPNLSFEKYHYVLFVLPYTAKAFLNSFLFATIASSLALILGILISYMNIRTSLKGRALLTTLAILPSTIPGTIVAIGCILAFSGILGLNLYNTMWILICAYLIKYLSFAIQNVNAALEQMDYSLEESARMSGAGWFKTFFTIVIPLLKPALIASWFFIFMPTFCELTMSVFLVGPNTETLGTLLFNLQSYDDPPSAAVLATLIVFVILLSNLSLKKITKGQYGV